MNKFGFFSFFITIGLFLLQFIPLGIYFGMEGEFCSWVPLLFGLDKNPVVNSYIHIPIEILDYQDRQVFLWGVISYGTNQLWIEINLMTFIFLFCLSPLTAIFALIGCLKENERGRKLIITNFFLLITIFLYCLIGIPLNSEEILGTKVEFSEIFLYVNYGFYIILLDLLFALIAISKHPMK